MKQESKSHSIVRRQWEVYNGKAWVDIEFAYIHPGDMIRCIDVEDHAFGKIYKVVGFPAILDCHDYYTADVEEVQTIG